MKKPEWNLGDAIDRLSILTRKIQFGEEDAISEHRYLERGLKAYGVDGKVITNSIRLALMNFEIWNLENELRKGGEDKFSMEEVGKKAIAIRNFNRKRVKYKNKLSEMTGGFKEMKVNHRSQ